jgi:hypothetical protein
VSNRGPVGKAASALGCGSVARVLRAPVVDYRLDDVRHELRGSSGRSATTGSWCGRVLRSGGDTEQVVLAGSHPGWVGTGRHRPVPKTPHAFTMLRRHEAPAITDLAHGSAASGRCHRVQKQQDRVRGCRIGGVPGRELAGSCARLRAVACGGALGRGWRGRRVWSDSAAHPAVGFLPALAPVHGAGPALGLTPTARTAHRCPAGGLRRSGLQGRQPADLPPCARGASRGPARRPAPVRPRTSVACGTLGPCASR